MLNVILAEFPDFGVVSVKGWRLINHNGPTTYFLATATFFLYLFIPTTVISLLELS